MHHGRRRRRGRGAGVGAGGCRHADRRVGRGARERERVAAEDQAGVRGGQARGAVEERVGSEEGEEHGGGWCGSALVAGQRGRGLVVR